MERMETTAAAPDGGLEAGAEAAETSALDTQTGLPSGEETSAGDERGEGERAGAEESRGGDPSKYKDIFAEHKELRDAYYGLRDHRRAFPTAREAMVARRALEGFGGVQGVQERIAQADDLDRDWRALDTQFKSDPKAFFDALRTESADAAAALTPVALAACKESDPDGYERLQCAGAAELLERYGVAAAIRSLGALVQGPGGEIVRELLAWIEGVGERGRERPKPEGDAATKRALEERAQAQRDLAEVHRQQMATEINRFRDAEIDKHAGALLKARGVDFGALRRDDPWGFRRLTKNIDSEIAAHINGDRERGIPRDEEFLRQKQALTERGDRGALMRLYRAKIGKHAYDASKEVVRSFYAGGARKAPPRTAPGRPGAQGDGQVVPGRIRLRDAPPAEQIDYGRSTREMLLSGHAYLRGKPQLHYWD